MTANIDSRTNRPFSLGQIRAKVEAFVLDGNYVGAMEFLEELLALAEDQDVINYLHAQLAKYSGLVEEISNYKDTAQQHFEQAERWYRDIPDTVDKIERIVRLIYMAPYSINAISDLTNNVLPSEVKELSKQIDSLKNKATSIHQALMCSDPIDVYIKIKLVENEQSHDDTLETLSKQYYQKACFYLPMVIDKITKALQNADDEGAEQLLKKASIINSEEPKVIDLRERLREYRGWIKAFRDALTIAQSHILSSLDISEINEKSSEIQKLFDSNPIDAVSKEVQETYDQFVGTTQNQLQAIPRYKQLVENGRKAYKNKDYTDAVSAFEQALEILPKTTQALEITTQLKNARSKEKELKIISKIRSFLIQERYDEAQKTARNAQDESVWIPESIIVEVSLCDKANTLEKDAQNYFRQDELEKAYELVMEIINAVNSSEFSSLNHICKRAENLKKRIEYKWSEIEDGINNLLKKAKHYFSECELHNLEIYLELAEQRLVNLRRASMENWQLEIDRLRQNAILAAPVWNNYAQAYAHYYEWENGNSEKQREVQRALQKVFACGDMNDAIDYAQRKSEALQKQVEVGEAIRDKTGLEAVLLKQRFAQGKLSLEELRMMKREDKVIEYLDSWTTQLYEYAQELKRTAQLGILVSLLPAFAGFGVFIYMVATRPHNDGTVAFLEAISPLLIGFITTVFFRWRVESNERVDEHIKWIKERSEEFSKEIQTIRDSKMLASNDNKEIMP